MFNNSKKNNNSDDDEEEELIRILFVKSTLMQVQQNIWFSTQFSLRIQWPREIFFPISSKINTEFSP